MELITERRITDYTGLLRARARSSSRRALPRAAPRQDKEELLISNESIFGVSRVRAPRLLRRTPPFNIVVGPQTP